MPRLVFIDPEFADRISELASGTTTVGRGSHNRLVIPHKSVSADHCRILVFGTEVIIRDKASTNGTFVDGCRIAGQLPVSAGQIVEFGSVRARLEFRRDELDTHDPDQTAHWEYARFKRGQSEKPAQPPPASPALAPPVPAREAEANTLVMVNPAAAPLRPPPTPPEVVKALGRPVGWRKRIAFAVGLLLLALVGLGLLLLARRHL